MRKRTPKFHTAILGKVYTPLNVHAEKVLLIIPIKLDPFFEAFIASESGEERGRLADFFSFPDMESSSL